MTHDQLFRSIVQQKLVGKYLISNKQVSIYPVSGGSINTSYRIDTGQKSFFCKVTSAVKFPQMFSKEKRGLQYLGSQKVIRVPDQIELGEEADWQVLLMEWITDGNRSEMFWKLFGEQLASLHGCTNHLYGFAEDNYMGSVEQSNHTSDNWIEFLELRRLRPLVQQCVEQKLLTTADASDFAHLYQKLTGIFDASEPASLLHGDLWSGNFLCNEQEQPVLIDPAIYYGHASVDLGMTELFGGFPKKFYEAYAYQRPLQPLYKEQRKVSNLYPLLIHLLLFGKSYLEQIHQTLHFFR